MTKSKVMTLTQIAEHLEIKKRTFYNMVKDGRFKVEPIKGTKPRLWNYEDVEAWRVAK